MKNFKKLLIAFIATFVATLSLGAISACVGEQGPQGDQGKSAYELYKEKFGYEGTEEEWLDDLLNGNLVQKEESEYFTEGMQYQKISGKEEYRLVGIGRASDLDIVIPSTYNGLPVTEIGDSAFEGHEEYDSVTYIESITIPDSVTSIGEDAFRACLSLTSITIPNTVTSIKDGAFYDCASLKNLFLPSSVTSLGEFLFGYANNFEEITVDNNNQYFTSENGILYNKDKTQLIIYPEGKKDISYDVPSSVISIADHAFGMRNDYLANISCPAFVLGFLPRSIISVEITSGDNIPDMAFLGCRSLTSITIPNSISLIGAEAFNGCGSLESITIPNSVTSIGLGAFLGCSSLASITIPDSVTSIGNQAFRNCSKLAEIKYNGTIEEWNAIEKGSNWNNNTGNYTVICTDGTLDKEGYKIIVPEDGNMDELELFTVSLIYKDGFDYVPFSTLLKDPNSITKIDAIWANEKRSLKATFKNELDLEDETTEIITATKASIKGLDDDYQITLTNLPEGFSYNPNIYSVSDDNRDIEIEIYKSTEPNTKRKGDSAYNCIDLTRETVYSVTLESTDQKIFFEYAPRHGGEYIIESWVDITANNINPKIDVYNGNSTYKVYNRTIDDGGAENSFTKNFKYIIEFSEGSIGSTITFAIYAEVTDIEYPITITFVIKNSQDMIEVS